METPHFLADDLSAKPANLRVPALGDGGANGNRRAILMPHLARSLAGIFAQARIHGSQRRHDLFGQKAHGFRGFLFRFRVDDPGAFFIHGIIPENTNASGAVGENQLIHTQGTEKARRFANRAGDFHPGIRAVLAGKPTRQKVSKLFVGKRSDKREGFLRRCFGRFVTDCFDFRGGQRKDRFSSFCHNALCLNGHHGRGCRALCFRRNKILEFHVPADHRNMFRYRFGFQANRSCLNGIPAGVADPKHIVARFQLPGAVFSIKRGQFFHPEA